MSANRKGRVPRRGSKANLPHVETGVRAEITWNRSIGTAVQVVPVPPWLAEPISTTQPVQQGRLAWPDVLRVVAAGASAPSPALYWHSSAGTPGRGPMSAVITERDLAAACRETLRLWPQARAAVLFGSRARGTQRPDSDWDIAIVLEGDTPRHPDLATSVFPRQEMPADLPHVDVWALSEDDLRRRACTLGTLPYVICRDGRVLAGDWNRPDPARMERDAAMNPEDWAYRMGLVVTTVDAAITPILKIAQRPLWAGSGGNCSHLLRNSADAAELLVKAAMERRGVPADRSHDIARLVAAFAAQRPDEGALP